MWAITAQMRHGGEQSKHAARIYPSTSQHGEISPLLKSKGPQQGGKKNPKTRIEEVHG